MKTRLKALLEDNESTAGRRFDWFVQGVILLSLVTFAVETDDRLAENWRDFLEVLEVIIVAFFTCEYIARLYVADSKWRYSLSGYGIIDLLAIAPFYLALVFPPLAIVGADSRVLRVLRLFRLFRMLKLVRYSRSIQIFLQAFSIAKYQLILFFVVIAMLLYLAAAGIYIFEHEKQPDVFGSWFESLWWAVVTLTTVGYGDAYPVTLLGKVFTFFLLLIGIGTIAVPSGIIASAIGEARKDMTETKE